MPYALLADVLDAAPKITLGPSTKPSVEDAEKIISQVSQTVDSFLIGLGYSVPITKVDAPLSFDVLKEIVVQGALAKILKAMFYGVKDPDDVGANEAWKEYNGKLKALADPNNPFGLPDAPQNIWAKKAITELDSHVLNAAYVSGNADVDGYSEASGRLTRNQVF